MDYKDYYRILAVDRQASADDIKKAYRKLARKYHPDVSKEADASERMAEVNEANAVLSDPEKRAAYDALADAPRRSGPGAGGCLPPEPGWSSSARVVPWPSRRPVAAGPVSGTAQSAGPRSRRSSNPPAPLRPRRR